MLSGCAEIKDVNVFLSAVLYVRVRACEHALVSACHLLRQLQFGAVRALFGLQAHEVGHRGVQEVQQRSGKDGHVHMLPLEGKQ